jgi:hypothetical protein
MVGLEAFIESLPPHLNQQVTLSIYSKTFDTHPLFLKMKNKRCLAYIGSKLHPRYDSEGAQIYKANEEITTLIIVNKGIAAFVWPALGNAIFALVDPNEKYACSTQKRSQVVKHLGFEDSVVNHLELLGVMEDEKLDSVTLDKRTNLNLLSKRFFTVRAIEHMESLTLKITDID